MARNCIENDEKRKRAFGEIAARLGALTADGERGLGAYQQASRAAQKSGLLDFLDRIAEALDDPAALSARLGDMADVFTIIGRIDDNLTPAGRREIVRSLWRGGEPDSFDPTIGVLKTMHQLKQDNFGGSDVFYLLEVWDADYHRRVDILVHRKPTPDATDLPRVIPDLVISSVEVKWYSATTPFDSSGNIEQVTWDLIRSAFRDQDFRDLRYAFPDDYPDDLFADIGDELLIRMEGEVRDTLVDGVDPKNFPTSAGLTGVGYRRWTHTEVDALVDALNAAINAGMIMRVPRAI